MCAPVVNFRHVILGDQSAFALADRYGRFADC